VKSPRPISSIPKARLAGVRAVLTDIDDTLTTHGKLPAKAYAALERLHAAGIAVVPITGRPAGWCDHIARMWPVNGVVGENGAFYFRYDAAARCMDRVYSQDAATRTMNADRLWKIARDILKKFPGTAIASDQAYREIDVAIDFCEDVPPLPLETAQEIALALEAQGATAKVSSIHVNAWFGAHDKLGMSLRFLEECVEINDQETVSYCGDSPNDAPMFGYFDLSIGVANVQPFLGLIEHPPAYITTAQGGEGFAEFADMLLKSR
jgi:HAD superfamily hydrolase (TIGR01484 family)